MSLFTTFTEDATRISFLFSSVLAEVALPWRIHRVRYALTVNLQAVRKYGEHQEEHQKQQKIYNTMGFATRIENATIRTPLPHEEQVMILPWPSQ